MISVKGCVMQDKTTCRRHAALNRYIHMPAWNFMAITEPLWLLYCRVQSPNSVTQHLADPSAEPLYISRFTTRMQITAFVCPSIVW